MSRFPVTQLCPSSPYTTAILGSTIQIYETSNGGIRHTVTDSAGPIRCAAIDRTSQYLATAGDDKILKIWEIDGLRLVNERELPKRPTSILFTADAKTILVSDKFGDVFSYTFDFTPLTEKQKKDALSSHENPSGGALVLGHASLLNAFLLSRDEKYIITADRDEHIRVSWYPQGYNVERYCLGHTKFVSALHNPVFAPAELVSGGGDTALKIWDWMTGTVKHEIPVWDAVEPYIHVRSTKRKRGDGGEDASEAKRKGRGKKAKGKGKGKGKDPAEEDAVEEQAPVPEASKDVAEPTTSTAESVELGEKVLVIRKIETSASRYIIFSAVGATALFSVNYPEDGATTQVRVLELGQPVLDFVVVPTGNLVWVTLDGNWAEGTEPTNKSFVQLLKITESGEFTQADSSPLLEALNSQALPATAEELQKLELYIDLVAMPKGHDGEINQEGDGGTEAPETVKQNKKILGRLKNKQKVLEKEAALASAPANDAKEPDTKRPRSEVGEDNHLDVDMADA